MKKLFIIILFASIFFIGCKKDNAVVKSKTELITASPWILKAYTGTRISDGVITDAYAPMSPCYKDDQYIFKTDYTYEGNAGATKCNAADPQVFQSGIWQFEDSESKIRQTITSGTGSGNTLVYTIILLTPTELKLRAEESGYIHNLTYSH